MNITPSLIYLITRLDYVIAVAFVCALVAIATLVIASFVYIDCKEDEKLFYCKSTRENAHRKALAVVAIIKVASIVLVACTILCAFVPSTKAAAAMIVVPKIANSGTIRELGGDLGELAKEWVKELKPLKGDAHKGLHDKN